MSLEQYTAVINSSLDLKECWDQTGGTAALYPAYPLTTRRSSLTRSARYLPKHKCTRISCTRRCLFEPLSPATSTNHLVDLKLPPTPRRHIEESLGGRSAWEVLRWEVSMGGLGGRILPEDSMTRAKHLDGLCQICGSMVGSREVTLSYQAYADPA